MAERATFVTYFTSWPVVEGQIGNRIGEKLNMKILTPDWDILFHHCGDRDKFDKCVKCVSRALLHCVSHSDNVGHHQMKFPQREIIRPAFWLSEPSTNSYVTSPHLPPSPP